MGESQKLDRSNVEDILALTPMQSGMLLQYLKNPDTTQYVELIELEIHGEIDEALFEQSWLHVVEANEALRVVFRWEEVSQPVQIVLKRHRPAIRFMNYTHVDETKQIQLISEAIQADKAEKFRLDEVPFRITLFKRTEQKHTLLMSFHHILFDGWSTGIVLKEWLEAYHSLQQGLMPTLLGKPRLQQLVSMLQHNRPEQESYWRNYFQELGSKPLATPKHKVNSGGPTEISVYSQYRDRSFMEELQRYVQAKEVTQAALLYTAWGILLQYYTNSDDVMFGTTVSGRNASISNIDRMVGLFINTLPFRMQAYPDSSLSELVGQVNRSIHVREEYSGTSLTDIKAYAGLWTEGNPFDSLVVIENYPLDKALTDLSGTLAIVSHRSEEETEFDLTLRIQMTAELEMSFVYNMEVYNQEWIERLAHRYLYILEQIISFAGQDGSEDGTRLKDLSLLLPEEEQRIYEFNQTAAEYPDQKLVHELFEDCARLHPEQLAVSDGEKSYSYTELNAQANRIAHMLQQSGLQQGQVVGLMVRRSTEMVAAIFGVLKAGGAYLPLDSAQPGERIEYMLSNGQVRRVLAVPDLAKHIPGAAEVLLLDNTLLEQGEAGNLVVHLKDSAEPAYVMYTSGSTGTPKGVVVTHRNIIRLVCNTNYVQVLPQDRMLQAGAIGFDALTFEVFGALLNGASLHIADKHTLLDPARLDNYLRTQNISTGLLTPALFNQMAQQRPEMFNGMRDLVVGGDVLSPKHIEAVRRACPKLTIWNAYGPTENTVISTCFRIDREYSEQVPIGSPIHNSTAYIVDRHGQLMPMGIPGELVVGGDGVARGYLNQPELTAERFIPDRFRGNGMMYKTGDLARWHVDGYVEYLGRMDNQVKIRGHRIETGEVENVLLQHPLIQESAVTTCKRGEQTELCAYVVASEQAPAATLRAYLMEKLPDYAIPSHFIYLEQIPLTPNGKLDRKSLPEPELQLRSNSDAITPTTEMEQLIAEAWKAVLGLENVSIHDKYFEIGGNSINLIQLQSMLQRRLKRDIPIVALFHYPTIHELAEYLTEPADRLASDPDDMDSQGLDPEQAAVEGISGQTASAGAIRQDIAIIGMAGRFPGARDIGAFWDNLLQGKESISFFTEDELAEYGFDRELMKRPEFVKAKGVLDDMDQFDPAFFGYTPDQAAMMDPQIRLLHECAWHALEDAGCDPERSESTIGLFAGVTNNFHWLTQLSDRLHGSLSDMFEVDSLNDSYTVSTRISHKLNLKGPAISLQTACSTSLVAVHLACQSILNGDCEMALAGGASIVLPQKSGYLYQEGMVKSPDGHCRTFDAKARGTIGGDGVAFVALKSLDTAIADGDQIYAVIKGSAINNDGSRKVGFTAPSVQGQADAIAKALKAARVPAESITYVEAHGSGTTLGDPIEVEALTKAFHTSKKGFCRIGSVKTNIGHLDAAAGVAGLIKTALALRYKQIPPSLHFETPNPNIHFADSPFIVNSKLTKWERGAYPLRAGVSSFGIGGTNAHVILEEAPVYVAAEEEREEQLLVLSAQSPAALDEITGNLLAYLQKNQSTSLADIAYTLQYGRRHFKYRRMLCCESTAAAIEALTPVNQTTSFDERKVLSFVTGDARKSAVFMFSGQGSQYIHMGAGLYEEEPIFRTEMDHGFALYRQITGEDLKEIVYPSENHELAAEHLTQTKYIQPAIFLLQYSLARLLLTWGIKPEAMIGYSFGEYTAACLAKVMSLEEAMRLIILRGELMQSAPAGAMLSVPLTEEELKPFLSGSLSLGVVNGESCIVAGTDDEVAALEQTLRAHKLMCMRLPVSTAGHSSLLQTVIEPFAEAVRRVNLQPPAIPYVSTTTGKWITAEEATDPDYWIRHMTDTVRFAEGIAQLAQQSDRLFIEVGPGQDLTVLVRRHLNTNYGQQAVNLIRPAQREASDVRVLVNRIGRLWMYGLPIQWKAFHRSFRTIVSLPGYPFARQRYWLDKQVGKKPQAGALIGAGGPREQDKLDKLPDMADWFYLPTWKKSPLPRPSLSESEPQNACANENANSHRWLVFLNEANTIDDVNGYYDSDCSSFGRELADRIAGLALQVITVSPGEHFMKAGAMHYILNPQDEEHYTKLFSDLQAKGLMPTRLLHTWGIRERNAFDDPLRWLQTTQELGFYSLLYTAKAMKQYNSGADAHLWVLSSSMQAVAGEKVLYPEKATALGPCRVIPQELPFMQCSSIDVLLPEEGSWQRDKLLDRLLEEFRSMRFELATAYRDNQRWVLDYEPIRVAEPTENAPGLRQGGVYLITGGLGYIGQVLGSYLARSVQAKLVLTSRSSFPARESWEEWLNSHGEDDIVSKQIRKLYQLEQEGAEVLVLHAEAADLGQMQSAIAAAEAKFGPIHGVIHAAGMTGDAAFSMLEETEEMRCEQHFSAKLYGLLVLEQALKGKELDFCLLTSSLSPMLGGLGFVAYAAANHFMDAFVHDYNRRSRVPWTCINWDGWQLQEEQTIRGQSGNRASISDLLIVPEEGVELFRRLLTAGDVNQLVISTGNLQERIIKWVKREAQDSYPNLPESDEVYYARPVLSGEYETPATDTERQLCGIWERMFRIEPIGVHDDFFELGGDSLKAITVVTAIHKELRVEISLPDFFNMPTIRQLSIYIESAEQSDYFDIEPAQEQAYYELSSAQKRLYLIQQMGKEHTGYNEIVAGILEGSLDVERLADIFRRLIERHASLRTSFEPVDGKPMQRIHPTVPFEMEYADFTTENGSDCELEEAERIREAIERFVRPFDLSRAPLMRAGVLKLGEQRHALMVDMHHIVSDGLSQDIFVNDFMALYDGRALPELTLQYTDFSEWQNKVMVTEAMKKQGDYWLQQLKDAPSLALRTDYPRPAMRSFQGSRIEFALDESKVEALKALCLKEDVTLFMALLAVFNLLLAKLSVQDDIVIGTPIVGRKQQALQLIIGKFVNMLPIRIRLNMEMSFIELLQAIRATTLEAFANQEYQFEEMVQRLGKERELARNPIFDVVFAMQNMQNPDMSIPGLVLHPFSFVHDAAHFDLSLIAEEDGKYLSFKFEYSTSLFRRETIERFARYMEDIVTSVLKNPAIQLKDIAIEHHLAEPEPVFLTSAQGEFEL
ncbi:non-ribosomal peptide synthetase/type I polyketide synthase [Paenibacillus lentus]|uniref:Phenolphthiocerol/phthiocerol polyketide synthase subunit E n=1 Tax=Paenibacillus lentus TaxID=1338368 RepID=A0A3S8S094_9BACL|nr:non-ribosomal peptide synthetase/type I polyketide synthase [Paenibacillus lentus]AZK48524.1 amino acid adenylation domain-containing protein [Paenibacillus lentus]